VTTALHLGKPAGPAGPRQVVCPFGANCSCALSGNRPVALEENIPRAAQQDGPMRRAVKSWTDLGFRVTASSNAEVVLERKRMLGFCSNLFLTAATGLLWLFYWIPRMRRPIFDRVVLTQDPESTRITTARTSRR
jgi:hypothetical protein